MVGLTENHIFSLWVTVENSECYFCVNAKKKLAENVCIHAAVTQHKST